MNKMWWITSKIIVYVEGRTIQGSIILNKSLFHYSRPSLILALVQISDYIAKYSETCIKRPR